jgi:hypothetical protein
MDKCSVHDALMYKCMLLLHGAVIMSDAAFPQAELAATSYCCNYFYHYYTGASFSARKFIGPSATTYECLYYSCAASVATTPRII